jgi:glycosyltransferase involved in cell wall biosynthesis
MGKTSGLDLIGDEPHISLVIPVYNSQEILPKLLREIDLFFQKHPYSFEIIFINDGSTDDSVEVLRQLKNGRNNIGIIDLEKNYGQHTALFCGLQHTRGAYIITLDDDLQNPPREMIHLINKISEGYDVVIGRFRSKKHARFRRFGTQFVDRLNNWLYKKPTDLKLSNFRILRRETIIETLVNPPRRPYIQDILLRAGAKFGNVWVEHQPRESGKSGYGFSALGKLVLRILLNRSSVLVKCIGISGLLLVFILAAVMIQSSETMSGIWFDLAVALWACFGLLFLGMIVWAKSVARLLDKVFQKPLYKIKNRY